VEISRGEREEILALRRRVLSEPDSPVSTLSRDRAPRTRHWVARVDGAVVGCVSVMPLRGWALRGMAVAPEHQRQGVGTRLLGVVCAEVGAPMWCNARLGVVPFYAAQGWVAEGPVFRLGDGHPHQRMTWSRSG
jgi:GNAT superfamily N-acetyltransferase